MDQLNPPTGHELKRRQIAQEVTVPVRNLLDNRLLARLKCGQGPSRRRHDPELRIGDWIAVRVLAWRAERLVNAHLEFLGERVFEPVCFGVDGVEAEFQRLGKVQLEQAMVTDHLECNTLTRKEMKNLLAVEISARGVFVKDRNVGASTRKQGSSRFEI